MKTTYLLIAIMALCSVRAHAQFDWSRALKAGAKTVQAVSISDDQIKKYVKSFIDTSDKKNVVCEEGSPYALRLDSIVGGINNRDGINIKVYKTPEVNAFACADGSIRVYSGLMDIMSNEEVLGVIGHEIGHIKNSDTKDAFRNALLSSALRDGIAATSKTAAKLTDSQLGDLGEALSSSKFSKKQEYAADNYGYDFLKSHGKNPWAMALSFKKLYKMETEAGGKKSGALDQLLSTHPDIVERTKRMAERATKDGFKRPE